MFPYLVFLGAFAQIVGIFFYTKETLLGNTKPNRVTWLMWTIAPLIGTFAAISDGVTLAVLPVFMSGFGPLIVFIASFFNPKSYWKLNKFDYLCCIFSALALIFWGITKEPLVAIFLAIISDGFAGTPTLIKAWKYPETESVEAFTTGLFSALTSFFALKTLSFSEIAFPLYLVLANLLLIIAIIRKKS